MSPELIAFFAQRRRDGGSEELLNRLQDGDREKLLNRLQIEGASVEVLRMRWAMGRCIDLIVRATYKANRPFTGEDVVRTLRKNGHSEEVILQYLEMTSETKYGLGDGSDKGYHTPTFQRAVAERFTEYFGEAATKETISRLRRSGDDEVTITHKLEDSADREERKRRMKTGESESSARQAVYENKLRRRGLSDEMSAEQAANREAYIEKGLAVRQYSFRWLFKALPLVAGMIAFGYCASIMRNSQTSATTTAQNGDTVTIRLESDNVYLPCGSTAETLDELIKWSSITPDMSEVTRIVVTTGSVLLNNRDVVKVIDRGFVKSKIRVLASDKECWVPTEAIRK